MVPSSFSDKDPFSLHVTMVFFDDCRVNQPTFEVLSSISTMSGSPYPPLHTESKFIVLSDWVCHSAFAVLPTEKSSV